MVKITTPSRGRGKEAGLAQTLWDIQYCVKINSLIGNLEKLPKLKHQILMQL